MEVDNSTILCSGRVKPSAAHKNKLDVNKNAMHQLHLTVSV